MFLSVLRLIGFIIVMVLFLVTPITCRGQATISGFVFLGDSMPAIGAFVKLSHEKDTSHVFRFTAANSVGEWYLANVPTGAYHLSTDFLGYHSSSKLVRVGDTSHVFVSFNLKPNSIQLPGVTVTSEALGLVLSGDTIKFNINYFSQGTEVNLGDVLQQLPGISVSENGQIEYAGKPIDKLLIQGKDILAGKNKLALQSIRAHQLKTIHLIDDYREVTDIETTDSETMVLDVRMSNDHLDWSGQEQLLVGYNKRYGQDLSTFFINKKVGANIFLKLNNTENNTLVSSRSKQYGGIFFRDKLVIETCQPSLEESFDAGYSQVERGVNASLMGAIDVDLSDKFKLKGDFFVDHIRSNQQLDFSNNLYFQEDWMSGEKSTEDQLSQIGIKLVSKRKFSDNFMGGVGISMFGGSELKSEHMIGILDQNDFVSEVDLKRLRYFASPELLLKYRIKPKLLIKWQSRFVFRDDNRNGRISDSYPFMSASLIASDSTYFSAQDVSSKIEKMNHSFSSEYDVGKGLLIDFTAFWNRQQYQANYHAPDGAAINLAGQVLDFRNCQVLRLGFKLDTLKWYLAGGLNRVVGGRNTIITDDSPFGMDFFVEYRFRQMTSLILGYNNLIEFPNIRSVSDSINELMNSRALLNRFVHTPSFRNMDIDLSFIHSGQASYGIIYGRLGYMVVYGGFYPGLSTFPDYSISAFSHVPKTVLLNGHFSLAGINIPILPLTVNMDYMIVNTSSQTMMDDQKLKLNNITNTLQASLATSWEKMLSIRGRLSLNFSEQQVGPSLGSYSAFGYAIEFGLKHNSFLGHIAVGNNQYDANQVNNNLWDLDFDIGYKIKKTPIQFLVKGRNLLNLQPYTLVQADFARSYTEILNISGLPGYLLAGFSWEF